MIRILSLVAALTLFAAPGPAQEAPPFPAYAQLVDTLPDNGLERLADWEENLRLRLSAIVEAPSTPEIGVAAEAMLDLIDSERVPVDDPEELIGSWQVRALIADPLGAYSYRFFPARIFAEAQALIFLKDSGSQRHQGMLAQADADHYLFVGALYYADEARRLHSAQMAVPADPERDELAALYKLADGRYLMGFAERSGAYRLYEMRRSDPQ